MKLKKQFENAFVSDARFDSENAVKIAEEFAIGFAEWLITDWHNDERWSIITDRKELLEIYKEEKEL
jgi:hypothetical protein